MTRINTNVVSLTAQRNLAVANASVSQSLQRLSTGLQINTGKDDPAGLIASERLRSEMVALESAISNNTRASNLIATAEASLAEINGLLLDIQGLVDTAANSGGMTTEEIAANQLLVDEAVDSITRIATTATFNGKKLLDGSLGGYTTTLSANVDSVTIDQVDMDGLSSRTLYINYDATTSAAAKGELHISAANIALATGTITVSGNLGSAQITLAAAGSNTQASILAAVNAVSAETGVVASNDGTGLAFTSAEYGSTQFVSIGVGGAAVFDTTLDDDATAAWTDLGSDLEVEGVGFISGTTDDSGVSVEGATITVRRDGMEITIEMDPTLAADGEDNVVISGNGGAKFQIGAEINSSNQITVAIDNVDAASLGTTAALTTLKSGQANSLDNVNGLTTAATIVAEAISTVSNLRGRLGAVQANTLETQISSLGTTLENVTSAESIIRDTDFAEETANLTRAQILVQAGTSVLAMANSAPQNVLSLLQG